jgi:hypothetical protein
MKTEYADDVFWIPSENPSKKELLPVFDPF